VLSTTQSYLAKAALAMEWLPFAARHAAGKCAASPEAAEGK